MEELESYLKIRQRPSGRPSMLQRWDDLTFLHQRVEPEVLQASVPMGLKIDTFPDEAGREWAYIGLVPFRMRRIRLPGLPALPYLSAFPETNVRT